MDNSVLEQAGMADVTSAGVTFLFTDIEGSTRLWETRPEAMRNALARHDALLHQAIADSGGSVFKTMGDAFCAVFPVAADALHAALAAQTALLAEEDSRQDAKTQSKNAEERDQDHTETQRHGEVTEQTEDPAQSKIQNLKSKIPTPLFRVRMALHTGSPEQRDNDYFGPPLNRVARLLAAAHGGQTLLSLAAKEAIGDALPPGVRFRDMGEHRLRDLMRSERIFQLLHPDLPSEFPPLKSLSHPALPNNLPQQLTSFIGRERESAEIAALLQTTRLLTLTGMGGCGKTRLALQVAADALETYPDGVWLTELASLSDPALVPQTVASMLNVREQAGVSLLQSLVETLKPRKMLLVLDNCEHLLLACAQLADTLLRACPHIRILASSREALGIAGEQTYRVPSLALPDENQPVTRENVGRYEAVRLCIERARLVRPDFQVTNENAPALTQLCARLDGIPFAIELAAARVRSLSIDDINRRLDDRFRLLVGGSRTAQPRQQTLRGLIDWSYALLNESEKTLLRRLSVFTGGWTLDAAEQVGAGESPSGDRMEEWETLDLLTSLVDKSLVAMEEQANAVRYRLLETVREYAREQLAASGEAEAVRRRHRDVYARLAEEARQQIEGAEAAVWLRRLESEHDNLRAALDQCAQDADGGATGLELIGALQRFWLVRGYLSEGREQCQRALSHPGAQAGTKARGDALNGAGNLAYAQRDLAAASALYKASLALRRVLGDEQGVAATLGNLGNIAGDWKNFDQARLLHREALTLKRKLNYRNGQAITLICLGNLAVETGEYGEARPLYEEARTICEQLGNDGLRLYALRSLGEVAFQQEDVTLAKRYYLDSLRLCQQLGERLMTEEILTRLASVEMRQAAPERAARLFGAAAALRAQFGDAPDAGQRSDLERDIATLQSALGETAFAACFADGRRFTWEQATAYALDAKASGSF